MKRHLFLYILVLTFLATGLEAQVSHGGKPLPLAVTRSSEGQLYMEMPSFDVAEELRIDSLNESDLRSGFRFAYKFITNYTPDNSGVTFTLADGTRVWRLGIYSPGALSLNVLFTEYELPEGAQLFLYNEDQSQVLGSFNQLNNSELNLLPIAPVSGERLIIEYQEPSGAPFRGRLAVGEVNHAYRSLRMMEPGDDASSISYIPPLACFQDGLPNYEQWGRSVVLLIIDGSVGCTASLVNNTENDGKPYLLTASHCLNNQFKMKNPDYEKIAGRVVCFFNYDSPFCKPILRGTEEMSTASAKYRAVNELGDMALLELLEIPPVYYRPYYAGWNVREAGESPYVCIQHPQYAVKRISVTKDALSLRSMTDPNMIFYKEAHWFVSGWNTGYTAAGSSGAPLFNAKGEIIGALSGGESTYMKPNNDYFFRLLKCWDATADADRQLKYWLNPLDDGKKACAGLDPYASSPALRLSNVRSSGQQQKAECAFYPGSLKAPLFGNNPAGIREFAEAYQVVGEATLYGAYLVTPPAGQNYKDMEVEVTVYRGDQRPTTLIYKETFRPAYRSFLDGDKFTEIAKPLNRAQETYVNFSTPVLVSGTFFIGYHIKNMPDNAYFAIYSLPKGQSAKNTAWVLDRSGWVQAPAFGPAGFSTSLFIDPVIQYGMHVDNERIDIQDSIQIFQGAVRGTVYVSLPEGSEQASYTLVSAHGKIVRTGTIRGNRTTLDFPDVVQGIYFMRINLANTYYAQKLVF